jgi:hypothetical protein
MTGHIPLTAVHAVTLYQAVCHVCDWESPLLDHWRTADEIGELHAMYCDGPRSG